MAPLPFLAPGDLEREERSDRRLLAVQDFLSGVDRARELRRQPLTRRDLATSTCCITGRAGRNVPTGMGMFGMVIAVSAGPITPLSTPCTV